MPKGRWNVPHPIRLRLLPAPLPVGFSGCKQTQGQSEPRGRTGLGAEYPGTADQDTEQTQRHCTQDRAEQGPVYPTTEHTQGQHTAKQSVLREKVVPEIA